MCTHRTETGITIRRARQARVSTTKKPTLSSQRSKRNAQLDSAALTLAFHALVGILGRIWAPIDEDSVFLKSCAFLSAYLLLARYISLKITEEPRKQAGDHYRRGKNQESSFSWFHQRTSTVFQDTHLRGTSCGPSSLRRHIFPSVTDIGTGSQRVQTEAKFGMLHGKLIPT